MPIALTGLKTQPIALEGRCRCPNPNHWLPHPQLPSPRLSPACSPSSRMYLLHNSHLQALPGAARSVAWGRVGASWPREGFSAAIRGSTVLWSQPGCRDCGSLLSLFRGTYAC